MLTFKNSGSWWNSNRQMHWKKVGSRDREDLPFEEFPSRDRGGSSKTYNPSRWHWGKGMISHHKSKRERERERLGLLSFEKSSTFSWLLLISCISASNIFLRNFLKVKSRLEIYKKNAEAILSIYANIMKKVFLRYRYFYNFFSLSHIYLDLLIKTPVRTIFSGSTDWWKPAKGPSFCRNRVFTIWCTKRKRKVEIR